MSNEAHSAYLGETNHQWNSTEVRRATFTDLSPEIVIEALSKVTVKSWRAGTQPRIAVLPARFRKRLAHVKEY